MTDYIKREDAIEAACMGCNDDFSNEPCEPSDCDITRKIMELPSADVVEAIPRNDRFNIIIGELLEIEARADIGCFTSMERADFGFYVSRLLFDMTKEVKHE